MLDTKVCRTCQKTVDKKDGSAKLDEVDPGTEITLRTKLHICVPEMMLADSNEDVICMICTNMLNLSYMFRNICIKTEQARHHNELMPELTAKIKNEADDTGIIVTRLQYPTTTPPVPKPLTCDQRTRSGARNSRSSPAAAAAVATVAPPPQPPPAQQTHASASHTPRRKPREGATRSRKRRAFSKRRRMAANTEGVNSADVRVEEMNGRDDTLMMDGNQEPLLEVAYEESVVDSYERLSTASDYSIGSLRDIPEVIVRDPNTNIPPGGRTLRTRQNVSYVMPPDSPETVHKSSHRQSLSSSSAATSLVMMSCGGGGGALGIVIGGAASGSNEKGVSVDSWGGRGRKAVGGGGSGRTSRGGGGVAVKKESPGQQRSRLQSSVNLADVDVIDDFCRRTNRDPLEFLCSVPMLKCDTDIGYHPPPRGVMPYIDNCQCDLCGQQLTRYNSLRRHRMRHFSKYNFCCTICGRSAYERYEIREHLEKRHRLKDDLLARYIENSRLEKDPAKARYRRLNIGHDSTSRTNNILFNKTFPSAAKPQAAASHHQKITVKILPLAHCKPGPKSSKTQQQQAQQVTFNKPGPKSSKCISLPQIAAPVFNNSSSQSVKRVVAEGVAVSTRSSKAPQTVANCANSTYTGGGGRNVHSELKRRRMSVGSTHALSAKRKKVAQSNVGARFKYECVFCNVLVSDKDTLRVHLKSYHCNVCFKFFVGKSTRNAHHCLHVPQKVNDENYYLCLDCDDYKSKVHFLSHLEPYKTRKLDQLFSIHPRPTYDSHSIEEKRRILPTINCNLGKNNQECFFFCGDPDALKFHQVKVHGQTKLLALISADKLSSFEHLEKQIRPVKAQTQAMVAPSLSACLQDMQMMNYVEDFVDVEALDTRDTDGDPMAAAATERCSTCAEEMPNGPLEHECATTQLADELYKCEICLNSFDRLSLIEHMKVHMSVTVV